MRKTDIWMQYLCAAFAKTHYIFGQTNYHYYIPYYITHRINHTTAVAPRDRYSRAGGRCCIYCVGKINGIVNVIISESRGESDDGRIILVYRRQCT